MRKTFNHVGGNNLRPLLYRAHKENTRPMWMKEEVWVACLAEWKKEDHCRQSETNKANRAAATENGIPIYRGGSVSTTMHKKRLVCSSIFENFITNLGFFPFANMLVCCCKGVCFLGVCFWGWGTSNHGCQMILKSCLLQLEKNGVEPSPKQLFEELYKKKDGTCEPAGIQTLVSWSVILIVCHCQLFYMHIHEFICSSFGHYFQFFILPT